MDHDFSLAKVGNPIPIQEPEEIHQNGSTTVFLEKGTVSIYGENMKLLFKQNLDAETIFFYNEFLFSKTRKSFDIYRTHKSSFEVVFRSETYELDIFQKLKDVKFGRFFNGEPGLVGYDEDKWKFYSISVNDIGLNYPVWSTNAYIQGGLLKVDKIFNQENIIVEKEGQILIYAFDHISNLILLTKLPLKGQYITGYFQNEQIKDIIQIEKDAFLLFSFDNETQTFKQIYKEKINNFNPKIIDFDKDGVDEMIYNSRYGLQIKTYNKNKNKFYTRKVTGGFQYAAQSLIFEQYKKGLQAFKVEKRTKKRENDISVKKDFKSVFPEISFERSRKEKLIKDNLEIASLYQIDKKTGQVRFTLPALDAKNRIEFFFNYDGTSESVLGQGWSIDENKIVLIYGPSIYQEIKYYLVLKNVYFEMNKTGNKFSVEGYDVSFQNGEWEVKMEDVTWTFGGGGDKSGVIYQTKWRNWHGSGDDTQNRIFLPIEYHLSKMNFRNHTIYYDYIRTDKAYIKKIYDDKDSLNFFYENTNKNCFLEKYEMEGLDYKEEVNFHYEYIKGSRFLSGLSQKDETFLSFHYENGRMIEIKTPDASIEYKYVLSPGYDKTFSFDIKEYTNFTTFNLNEHLAIGYNHKNKTILELYDLKMEKTKKIEIPKDTIKNIINIKNVLCLIHESGNLQMLKNLEQFSFKFSKNATFTATSDFLLFQDDDIGVIEYDEFKMTKLFPSKNTTFSIFDQHIAFYDDQNINLAFKMGNKWTTKIIKNIPGFLSDIKETIDFFRFQPEYQEEMYSIFKKSTLQLYANMILITKWAFEYPKFKTYIKIMLLDQSHQIFKEEDIVIDQDDINELVKDTYFNGTVYKVIYKYDNGELKHEVVDYESKAKEVLNVARKELNDEIILKKEATIKEINRIRVEAENEINNEASKYYSKRNSRTDLIDKKVKEERRKVNENLEKLFEIKMQEFEEERDRHFQNFDAIEKETCQNMTNLIPNEYFMLDRGRYIFNLNDNQITSGHVKIVYSGDNFNVENLQDFKKNVSLDDDCSFQMKENYELICKNVQIDLEVNDLGMVENSYPFFIASPSKLVQFYKNIEPKIENLNATLLRNKMFLILKENTTVKVMPQVMRYFLPEYLIEEVRLNHDDRSIVTSYEYDNASLQNGRVVFNDVTVTPGKDKKRFGYVKNDSVYDGEGVFIKRIAATDPEFQEAKINAQYDKTGLLPIYERPEHLTRNEMYYFGFEDYEIEENLQYEGRLQKGFAFTGENYLKAKTLRVFLNPKIVDVYTLTTWVRTEKAEIGEKTVKVQINYGFYGSLGEILLERNGWYFVKANFDMAEAQSVNEMLGKNSESLEIKIIDCEIDHFKFSPEKSLMEVKVYDHEGRIREKINSNGLVRKIIRKKGQKVAEIDEFGDVERFQIESKRVRFEMTGRGRFEDFSLSSFGKTVAIDDPNWSVSPSQIKHLNQKTSILKLNVQSENFGLAFDFGLEPFSEITFGDIKINQNSTFTSIELLKIKNKIFLFSGGNVLLEDIVDISLDIKFSGVGFIKNLFIFDDPSVKIRHYDSLKNKIQDIRLRDESSAIVIEYLYDEIGRNDIITSPYVVRSEHLFKYHDDFVLNKHPFSDESVWKTGKIKGVPNEDGFMKIEYKNDPLNRKEVVQLPGNLTKRYIYDRKNEILKSIFPSGFYFVSEFKGGIEKTKIYDEEDNWRGTYLKDKGKATLSTYEYENKKVTQILPPLYHENAGTLRKLIRGETRKEKFLKKKIGINNKYDQNGRLIEKTSPDAGKTRYIYDADKLKFIIYPDSITYFQYDSGRLNNIGYLNNMDTVLYQTFNYGLKEKNPMLKDNVFRKITYDKVTIIEENVETNDLLKKRIIFPPSLTIEMTKKRIGNRLTMEYPVLIDGEQLKLYYIYDRTGQLSKIKGGGISIEFKYDEMNRPSEENFNGKVRHYRFTPAGFLKEISDEFMKEEISYDGSFTGLKFDEGIVHKLRFENRWEEGTEEDECFEIFKANNYTKKGYQGKVFYSELDLNVPESCPSVLRKRFPISYGHVYDYGRHDELVKAKFYIDRFEPPLTLEKFKRNNFTEEAWKELVKLGFIVEDKELSTSTLARKGKSIIDVFDSHKKKVVEKAILAFIAGIDIKAGTEYFQVIEERKGRLNKNFEKIFRKSDLKKAVRLLRESFATELGKAEFDVDYYAFDPNGNHRRFYNGIDRYELFYIQDTNKIDYMINQRKKFNFEHDEKGNVVKAEHKKIKKMTYNPVTNLVNEIEMDDNEETKIHFSYDSEGERVYKSVFKNGSLKTKVFYFRDEDGKCLLERKESYPEGDVQLTTYIYGNKGLIAFFRKDELYRVISDHEGSIRLVVKDEKVVAAFDYLPYGNLMRELIFDEDGLIFYRFTGQEYDPETGLYNYHARLYDPTIGRFYQIDPKWQSFSPYKYAGNSPVSMVDPDGEFFLGGLLIAAAVGGLVGAYVAGSARNNNWDPREWDWKSKETWTAIAKGAFTGTSIPISIAGGAGALTAVGLSTKIAYTATIGLTAANAFTKLAKPNSNWDLKSPQTWNEIINTVAIVAKETKRTLKNLSLQEKSHPKELMRKITKTIIKTISNHLKEISSEEGQEVVELVQKFIQSDESEKRSMLQSFKTKAPFMLAYMLLSNEEHVDKSADENYIKTFIKNSKKSSVIYEEIKSKLDDFKKSEEYAYIKEAIKKITNRGKREAEDVIFRSDNNVTLFSGYSDLFYINQGSQEDVSKILEEGLNYIKRVYTEKDVVLISELKKMLQNEVGKITEFTKRDPGFVIFDDRYKLFAKLTIDVLRNDSIKENMNEFVRRLYEENNFQKLLSEIKNPKQYLDEKSEEKNIDSIVMSTYCEPFVGYQGRITDKTWVGEIEGTSYESPQDISMLTPDFNGTLLLADVLLSKKQKRHIRTQRRAKMSKRENAMLTSYAIIEEFEKQYPGINLDFYEIQKPMQDSIANMRTEEILPLIQSCFHGNDLGVYEAKKDRFEDRLNKILFKSCQRLAGYDRKSSMGNSTRKDAETSSCDEITSATLGLSHSSGTKLEQTFCRSNSCSTPLIDHSISN